MLCVESGGIHIEHLDRKRLRQISIFARVVGAFTVLYGMSIAVQGLYAYLIGAVPGIISIIIGVQLFKSGLSAKRILKNHEQQTHHANELLRYYSYFLYLTTGLFAAAFIFLIYFSIVADITDI